MKYEDQVDCIVDIFNNPDNFLYSLNAENYLGNTRDVELCKQSASLHDAMESKGVFLRMFVSHAMDFELRERVLHFIALSCLHADEKQAHRLVENCSSFNVVRKELPTISIDIKEINISHIKNNHVALSLFTDLFRIKSSAWVDLAIERDDPELAKRLIETPNAIVGELELKNALGENTNIRKSLFGTSKYSIKDLFAIYTMPFTFKFDADVFNRKFDQNNCPDLLIKYGEHILAHCFQELKKIGYMNSHPYVAPEQKEAMERVIHSLLDQGIDWYKPWLASAENDFFPALIDLEDVRPSDAEKIEAFLNDKRIGFMSGSPILEKARSIMFSSFPVEGVCKALANVDSPDTWFDIFYRDTKNPAYLEKIKSSELKRHILSDELSM